MVSNIQVYNLLLLILRKYGTSFNIQITQQIINTIKDNPSKHFNIDKNVIITARHYSTNSKG
jgi:hypothetical protein